MDITANHLDITRALMMVGYPSHRAAVARVGRWRARMLHALAHGYLDASLRTTPYFRNLEQSERAATCFLLGQALTLWFAQEHMHLDRLIHVDGCGAHWKLTGKGAVGKSGAGPLKPGGRPDFLGIGLGEHHVFETKGRTRRVYGKLMATALAQASMLATINGRPPDTRVAACFVFRADGVEGQVQDPPAAPDALDLTFDEAAALRKAYAFFLHPGFRKVATLDVPGFLTTDLGDGIRFGIDEALYQKLADGPGGAEKGEGIEPILATLAERRAFYRQRRTEDTSVGNDGTLLQDPATPRRRRRRLF
ncbi:hypothetical protein [Methylobacterium sp. R2-1]|uniref:hypothetical protein n=1 Tax=Methylobacterium sp. R2-1 TaxID=2587064 RepID=UPI00160A34F6|nr:hypothetical protein [Methylobacterium sp. R2-1]MBB2961871.1 hypothetical protein [Methylobacterium sp. R2-1]